jgi:hypothetical protein
MWNWLVRLFNITQITILFFFVFWKMMGLQGQAGQLFVRGGCQIRTEKS